MRHICYEGVLTDPAYHDNRDAPYHVLLTGLMELWFAFVTMRQAESKRGGPYGLPLSPSPFRVSYIGAASTNT